MDHRQKDWPEWLASAEFVVNNKVHTATKILPFMANYRRELRMGENIRKRGKVERVMEFVERIKRVHKEAGVVLKKAQEDIKRQTDQGRKETEDWKRGDKVMLSTKDLVFKERPAKKLVDQYVGPYTIKEVVSANVLWDALDMNNFYFLFLLFSDFIGILFSFSFSFLLDNKEACDTAVT